MVDDEGIGGFKGKLPGVKSHKIQEKESVAASRPSLMFNQK